MNPEYHIDEQQYVTAEQQRQSQERQEAFERSGLGEWNQEDGTLLFNLDERLIITEQLLTRGAEEHLQRKPEFHVTIIGYKSGERIVQALAAKPEGEAQAIRQDIAHALEALNQGWRVAPEIWRIQKTYPKNPEAPDGETRTSYIQMMEMPALAQVYELINRRLDLQLEVPPTHITIMTGSTLSAHMTEGIGVPNQATLAAVHPEVIMTRDGEITPNQE